jgi:uncharacterized membrane protein HdeD (DUF308 family)
MASDRPDFAGLGHGLGELRGEWIWFIALGVVLILLGTVVLGSVVIASLAVAVVIGALILAGGVAESVGAFWCRRWSGFFLHLLSGLLSIVIGLLFLEQPVGALKALTLLTAGFLLVGGAFKIAATASLRFAGWGWPLFGGLIDVALGVMILMDFPASALWVLGMFLGISMVFRGVNWIGLGLALRSLPALTKPSGAPPNSV